MTRIASPHASRGYALLILQVPAEMSVVKEKYNKLSPRGAVLRDESVLAQAWKKTHAFIRRHNWYADMLELDVSAACLGDCLSEWVKTLGSGAYTTLPARVVPAPKNGLWQFTTAGWGPKRRSNAEDLVLRPLAHIPIREQTVATAVMLCLADCIESAQGDPSLEPAAAANAKVYSYGNRLYCQWSTNRSKAQFSWGSSDTYSRYFHDYQAFVQRPTAIAKAAEAEGEKNLFIVSMDLSAFFDNVDISLLIQKLRSEFSQFAIDNTEEYADSDEPFWALASSALRFTWHPDDEQLAGLFRSQILPSGLPQGLVASGFFANAYLLEFDREVGSQSGNKLDNGITLLDYCRYVDDIRLVISVDADESEIDPFAIQATLSTWMQAALKSHTTPSNRPDAYLRINPCKTELEPLGEVGADSGTAARMKSLQHQLSGPFDLESLRQTEAGLNGLLSLAELALHTDDLLHAQPLATQGLASVAKLNLGVRDDTLTRFSAFRLVRSLRMRRDLTDLNVANEGENARRALAQDFEATARRLVAAWATNPSLVQVLRYGLDLFPSTELLLPIQDALLSKTKMRPGLGVEHERRTAFYVLSEIFRAGATETGRIANRDDKFSVGDVEDYRHALASLARTVLKDVTVPWYVQQQAGFFLSSCGKLISPPGDVPELLFQRMLQYYIKGRPSNKIIRIRHEIAVSLIGHQILDDFNHYLKWFGRLCEQADQSRIRIAWRMLAETAPVLFNRLIISGRAEMRAGLESVPRSLIRYATENRRKLSRLTPNKWLPLLTIISNFPDTFSQENALLALARALGSSDSIRDSDPELLTSLNVELNSEDWMAINDPINSNLQARVVNTIITKSSLYKTPVWCQSEDAWMYAFGRLLRSAATAEPDFTTQHWVTREDIGWYSGLRSTWQTRRLGMAHSAVSLHGTSAAITPWFSDLLLQLLRWPGIRPYQNREYEQIKSRTDFSSAIERRLTHQASIYARSSRLPVYRYQIDWKLESGYLRVAIVQGLMPQHGDFDTLLARINEGTYREKHRSHTATLIRLATRHLQARDYVFENTKRPAVDLVVFPELSIHVNDRDLVRAFSDATGAMVFYGMLGASHPTTGDLVNSARWLIPQRRGGRRSWIDIDQGKFHLTPEEGPLGFVPWRPYQVVVELFDDSSPENSPYRLSGSICFDATDLALAADLRDESHLYVVSAMNKDVKTFDGMVSALRYHMYQHVLIANIGEFGGSTAQAPYDKEHSRLIAHSHGSNQLAVSIFDVNINDFGPRLRAAAPPTSSDRRIGKAPPAGLNRRRS